MLLAPEGPKPGRVVMNFRIFVGLWANAQTRSVQRARYKAAPAPAVAANFMKCRLLCMGNSSLRFSMRRTSHLSWLFSTERARPRAGQVGRATRTGYDGPGVRPAFTRKIRGTHNDDGHSSE